MILLKFCGPKQNSHPVGEGILFIDMFQTAEKSFQMDIVKPLRDNSKFIPGVRLMTMYKGKA